MIVVIKTIIIIMIIIIMCSCPTDAYAAARPRAEPVWRMVAHVCGQKLRALLLRGTSVLH